MSEMKPNIHAILQDCIEKGVLNALHNVDEVNFKSELLDKIVDEFIERINFEINLYFTFDDI